MIHVLSHIKHGVFEVRMDEMNMFQNNCVKVECCCMFVNSSYSNLNQVYEKREIPIINISKRSLESHYVEKVY
jgi:hypothetical protein